MVFPSTSNERKKHLPEGRKTHRPPQSLRRAVCRLPSTVYLRYSAPNLYSVVVRYVSPGRSVVVGNSGLLGESG